MICNVCGQIQKLGFGAVPLPGNECTCMFEECPGCGVMLNLGDDTQQCDCDGVDKEQECEYECHCYSCNYYRS